MLTVMRIRFPEPEKCTDGRKYGDGIENYATNYYTSGNGEIDLNGALEQLKGRKKVLENEIRMEMSRKQQKREKLEQEVSFIWRDVHHLEEELDRVEEELEYRAGKRKKNGKNGSWKENMEKVSWMRYVRKNGGSIRWRY